MQIINQKKDISKYLGAFKSDGKSVGFVPTMGALHAGHLSLVKEAWAQCDMVVVSIFVNPTQFNNPADLRNYPRSMDSDVRLIAEFFPKSIIFAPSAEEVYGGTTFSKNYDFGTLEKEMEGKYRSGHFDGVGTVLELLFDMVRPDKAFFGEKDFQQLQIIKKLVTITGQPVEIVGCPIARESNGLAMSSRNRRLTTDQFDEAAFVHQTLERTRFFFGTKRAETIYEWVKDQFEKNDSLHLEYFEIAETKTLSKLKERQKNTKYRAFIAAYIGEIRLIDNIALN